MKKLGVIDFFCGAGGFSEGFRQQGFEIIKGFDFWAPAVQTFNHNFNTSNEIKNIEDFYDSIEEIQNLEDTEIIIGSPPCVSFSSSNKSGKADKSKGIKLTESFLRVIAVKKHKKNSKLKAWFMENVENSKKHLKPSYKFSDLNLKNWAIQNGYKPNQIALQIEGNSQVINSANYGSFQSRKRLITGEIIKEGKFILPPFTHSDNTEDKLEPFKTIGDFKKNFPNPFEEESGKFVKDPNYNISLPLKKITDHFYDTGIYKIDWENSCYLKKEHYCMGKMAFPENEVKPSRTITATKIANSREAIIYESEIKRTGDGQYRTPTVREASIIMGFPITYQFCGLENTKWKLVGNAVCPSVSRALAKTVTKSLGQKNLVSLEIKVLPNTENIISLNTFKQKIFNKPPKKNKGCRFRRHPFKDGNMTVALTNYDIKKNEKVIGKWKTTIVYGTGKGFGIEEKKENYYKNIESFIMEQFPDGSKFISSLDKKLDSKVANQKLLQKMYEENKSIDGFFEPKELIKKVSDLIEKHDLKKEIYTQGKVKIFDKELVYKRQLYALYALNKIISITNS